MCSIPSLPLSIEYSLDCIVFGVFKLARILHQVAYFLLSFGIRLSETLVADKLIYYPNIIVLKMPDRFNKPVGHRPSDPRTENPRNRYLRGTTRRAPERQPRPSQRKPRTHRPPPQPRTGTPRRPSEPRQVVAGKTK